MRNFAAVSAIACLISIIGCSRPPQTVAPAEQAAPKPDEKARKAQADASQKAPTPSRREEERTDTSQDDGLAHSATLRRCIDLALLSNPEIRSAKLLASAMRHRVTLARSLDDPMVSTSVFTDPIETAAGPQHANLGFSQKLPFPGKLSLRGQVALEDARAAEQLASSVEQRVLADVKKTYYGIYVAQKGIDINRQNQALLASLARLAQVKYETGRGTKQDPLRAQVALSKLEDQLLRFRQELETAEARLNMLLNRSITAQIGSPADFEITDLDLRIGELLTLASERRPELLALKHAISRERAKKDLAVLNFFPDLTLGFTYANMGDNGLSRVANGRDAWALTFSTNVPIWYDRLIEGVNEAKDMLAKTRADYEQKKNMTLFEVKDAIVRVKTSEGLVRLFHDTIIPQAKETLEASQSSYEAGEVDFLTTLDNWSALLDFELDYYRAKGSLEQNYAELERAIGAELMPGGMKPEGGTKPQQKGQPR